MANLILLTGAGFTHNFGAPLASQMMSIIFNYRNQYNFSEDAFSLLKGDFNYETAYADIMKKGNNNEDKKSIKEVIKITYDDLDSIIKNHNQEEDIKNVFSQLLSRFTKKKGGSGKVFTLNQDLFIERYHHSNLGDGGINIPGLNNLKLPQDQESLERNKHFVTIDQQQCHEKDINGDFNYFKLHGSQNWYININGQDDILLILGADKIKEIIEVPLLESYMSIFEKELGEEDTKLLIIGYGFRDEHINEKLIKAHKKIEFHIICPMNISDYYDSIKCAQVRDIIWKKSYYYPCYLHDFFNQHSGMGIYFWGRLQR